MGTAPSTGYGETARKIHQIVHHQQPLVMGLGWAGQCRPTCGRPTLWYAPVGNAQYAVLRARVRHRPGIMITRAQQEPGTTRQAPPTGGRRLARCSVGGGVWGGGGGGAGGGVGGWGSAAGSSVRSKVVCPGSSQTNAGTAWGG